MNKKILVVDDEIKILEVVKSYLEREGFSVITETNGNNVLDTFKKEKPDLVILDLMLPGISGEELCKRLRQFSNVPILMLTAKVQESDKINGFSIGADDYITKPFSPRELVMRVKAILRRTTDDVPLAEVMSFNNDDLVVDLRAHTVRKKGVVVNLTPNEFKILKILIRNPNRVFTREELIEKVMGFDYEGYDRTIDAHIKNLRQKIEDDTKNPVYIKTVYGVGYKFGDGNV
ncbi:two-component system OmpR family response regulator [Caldanaerobacter subterraneus subsp. tengcongensis MB4]|jgi:two-component system OmpR family response regulator|uniref:Stage 0 sporulation protein A homolog n=1 Tax=Caldanaerobacter subterraneus subsp. tengcongensis (strain DSM 15242 / JCM 11007 / NBRC 100824 / MB4) TaxID=273068 RepID=Q8R7E1_CALS4|nr:MULTISPECIES: response regulator transcription factor [Thermoanaerobacteraceae]AAM25604.1 Response regulators consisting of a CheY-like receiver domain and a HTH DNA-binding domain [Caldanaerobacter subterraneus subsp. tengcongensis MB4]ABY92451.1 two component transcriptional regulator, winged helix family [Thermoanaerobacter sp. X514]MCS3917524.1 two-component system OmpR family response regulator [Caldanaerobacter subterraneus subsp. tengcongensis MB4]HCD10380.1 DNA-binding response regul